MQLKNLCHSKILSRRIAFLRELFILAILFELFSHDACSQGTYVPMNHWVYDYLGRLETRQVIQGVINGSMPLSRVEIARYLARVQKHEDLLSKVEQDQLNFLTIEFKEELSAAGGQVKPYRTRIQRLRETRLARKVPDILYQNNRNLLSWNEDPFSIYFDPILYYARSYSDVDYQVSLQKNFQRSSGFRAWGNFTDYLGFFIDVRDTKEWGTTRYKIGNYTLPRLGFVRATDPGHIYHDETAAYLKLGFEHLQITYGKFSNFWGPGRSGSLILSDYATSYDQVKLEFIFNHLKFTSIYAFLIDYKEHDQDVLQQKNYLAAHRLEFLPWQWLALGLSESVVFNGRSFEPAYLNPVMFFRSAEHYLGSPDNMMMGIDFKLTALKNFKFYGELFIDDITTTKLGTDWYGNKLGYQIGSFWVDPFKIKNADVRIEYTRIRPYVYSHKNSLDYKHYDSLLGHSIGPNADELYWEVNYRLSKWAKMCLFGEVWRHGANFEDRNVGGDVNIPHQFEDDLYANFLDGILEKQNVLGVQFSYEIFRDFYLDLGYEWTNAVNVVVKEDQRGNSQSHQFAFSIGLNY